MKTCTKCKEDKPADTEHFPKRDKGLRGECKSCVREYKKCYAETNKKVIYENKKAYREANKDKEAARKKAWAEANQQKVKSHFLKYYENNKSKLQDASKKYREANRDKIASRMREYSRQNRDQIRAKNKTRREQNGEALRASDRDRYARDRPKRLALSVRTKQRRLEQDQPYRMEHNIRSRVYSAIKNGRKSIKTLELLGCSIDELKNHLSCQFSQGMTWGNYGDWHIDHVRPCASFDLTDRVQQKQCFHYSNLQPLWAHDNLSKGAQWGGDAI